MALETGTYISDLVATNPVSGDTVNQADDHLRLLKSTIKATFPNVAGAVTPTHTELNYVDGVTSSIQTQLDQATLTSKTVQAATSGAAIDFTGIPSWAKRIVVALAGVSTNGTSLVMVQIGDSGGPESSGYLGSVSQLTNSGSVVASTQTAGFAVVASGAAGSVINGSMTMVLVDAATNTWAASGTVGFSDVNGIAISSGSKSLSATLDRIRVVTFNGLDTFDAGSINVLYE